MRKIGWAVATLVVGGLIAWGSWSPEVRPGQPTDKAAVEKKPVSYWRTQLTAGPGEAATAREQLEEGGGWSLPVLKELLHSEPHPEAVSLRLSALEILGKLGTAASPLQDDVLALLTDADEHVRTLALSLFPKLQIAARDALPRLQSFFDKPEAVVALRAAAEYRGQATSLLPVLGEILEDKTRSTEVRWNAARTIGKIGHKAAGSVPKLIACLDDPESTIREHCAEAIGDIGPPAAKLGIPALLPLLKDANVRVRRDTVRSLGQLGGEAREALPQIRKLAEDPEELVREAVKVAIQRLDGDEAEAPADAAGAGVPGKTPARPAPAEKGAANGNAAEERSQEETSAGQP